MVATTSDSDVTLDSMVCFDLYAASRALTAVYRRVLAEYELTYPQYLVLVVLWHHPQPTIKELADRLRLDYGTLTPLLRRMERAGLLTRARRSVDERIVTVTATQAGGELQRHESHIRAVIEEATGLTGAQIAALQQGLRTIITTSPAYQ